ncbi:hypothetical protein P3S68_005777 [Capsicum galapagoense]
MELLLTLQGVLILMNLSWFLPLQKGRLGGAGLDVLEHEPEVPMQLAKLDNVVLSPHISAATPESRKERADLVVASLEAYFSNKPLLTPVL